MNKQKIADIYNKNNQNPGLTIKQLKKEFGMSLKEAAEAIDDILGNNKPSSEKIGSESINYNGGHPQLTRDGNCTLTVRGDGITVSLNIFGSQSIAIQDIIDIHLETQEQIEERVTATRLFTLGVFAFAFKKKKKNSEKYLTVDFKDSAGLTNTMLFSGKNTPSAHALIYRALSEYLANTRPMVEKKKTIETVVINDPYEEVKKAKELLDMGIITQEEFDIKKKQLLDL